MTYIMSFGTILAMWLAGDKHRRYSWVVGLLTQVLWSNFIYQTKAYGLIPLNVILYIVNVRNLILSIKNKEWK